MADIKSFTHFFSRSGRSEKDEVIEQSVTFTEETVNGGQAGQSLFVLIASFASISEQIFAEEISEIGLTSSQLLVLGKLGLLQFHNLDQLAVSTGIVRPLLLSILQGLERGGLVKSVELQPVAYQLTEKIKEVIVAAKIAEERAEKRLLEIFPGPKGEVKNILAQALGASHELPEIYASRKPPETDLSEQHSAMETGVRNRLFEDVKLIDRLGEAEDLPETVSQLPVTLQEAKITKEQSVEALPDASEDETRDSNQVWSGLDSAVRDAIRVRAANQFPGNIGLQQHFIQRESRSSVEMESFSPSLVPKHELQKMRSSVAIDYPDSYVLQQRELKRRAKVYLKKSAITQEVAGAVELSVPVETLEGAKTENTQAPCKEPDSLARQTVFFPQNPVVADENDINHSREDITKKTVSCVPLERWARQIIQYKKGYVSLKEALQVFLGEEVDEISAKHVGALATKLSSLQIGLSPDPKYALKVDNLSDFGILFDLPHAASQSEEKVTQAYRSASLMLHLGVLAAQSDNKVVEEEIELIKKIVLKGSHLSSIERVRLQAELDRIVFSKLPLDILSGLLNSWSAVRKEQLANLAFQVVSADQLIEVEELNFLLWLYVELGFNAEAIQKKLHMIGDLPPDMTNNLPTHILENLLATVVCKVQPTLHDHATEENEVKPAEALVRQNSMDASFLAQENDQEQPSSLSIGNARQFGQRSDQWNEDQICLLRQSSRNSSALLQEVFGSEEEEEEEETKAEMTAKTISMPASDDSIKAETTGDTTKMPSEAPVSINGLDDQHARLLSLILATQKSVGRDDFERLSKSCGLMPDGAIETLNEWAYEIRDEAVIEDDEPMGINQDFLSFFEYHETQPVESHPQARKLTSPPRTEQNLSGQDEAHQKLLKDLLDLLGEENISQARIDELARSLGLSPGQALNTIRQWQAHC